VVVAKDGIVVVVHPGNGCGLTIDQVRGIFNGAINDWKQVRFAAGITVVSREAVGTKPRSSR
jgi:ABC-type phosphate transport system substrate-binding protein